MQSYVCKLCNNNSDFVLNDLGRFEHLVAQKGQTLAGKLELEDVCELKSWPVHEQCMQEHLDNAASPYCPKCGEPLTESSCVDRCTYERGFCPHCAGQHDDRLVAQLKAARGKGPWPEIENIAQTNQPQIDLLDRKQHLLRIHETS